MTKFVPLALILTACSGPAFEAASSNQLTSDVAGASSDGGSPSLAQGGSAGSAGSAGAGGVAGAGGAAQSAGGAGGDPTMMGAAGAPWAGSMASAVAITLQTGGISINGWIELGFRQYDPGTVVTNRPTLAIVDYYTDAVLLDGITGYTSEVSFPVTLTEPHSQSVMLTLDPNTLYPADAFAKLCGADKLAFMAHLDGQYVKESLMFQPPSCPAD